MWPELRIAPPSLGAFVDDVRRHGRPALPRPPRRSASGLAIQPAPDLASPPTDPRATGLVAVRRRLISLFFTHHRIEGLAVQHRAALSSCLGAPVQP
jgi:hypothetical protein